MIGIQTYVFCILMIMFIFNEHMSLQVFCSSYSPHFSESVFALFSTLTCIVIQGSMIQLYFKLE